MNKKAAGVIFFLFTFFSFNPVMSVMFFARTAMAEENFQMTTAQVAVKNFSLSDGYLAEDGNISGSFSVESDKAGDNKFFYRVSLILPAENSVFGEDALITDLSSTNQKIDTLGQKIDFSLPWPKNIASGVYDLRIDIYDASNVLVAFDSKRIPRQKTGDCAQIGHKFLSWNETDKLEPEKVLFGTGDQIYFGAEIFPMSNLGKTAFAHITVRKDGPFGEIISDFNTDEIILKAGEERFAMKKGKLSAGVYYAEMRLLDENNETISNRLNYRFTTEEDYTNNKDFENIFPQKKETVIEVAGEKDLGPVDAEKNRLFSEALEKSARMNGWIKILKMIGLGVFGVVLMIAIGMYARKRNSRMSILLFLIIVGSFVFSSGAQAGTLTMCIRSDLQYFNGTVQTKNNTGIAGTISGQAISKNCNSYPGLTNGTYPVNYSVTGNDWFNYLGNGVTLKFSNGTMPTVTVPGTTTAKLTMQLADLTVNVKDCADNSPINGATFHLDSAVSTLSGSSWSGQGLPGIYNLTYFSKTGYENSNSQNLVLNSGYNPAYDYCLKKKVGTVRIFTGMGNTCNTNSTGVPGATVTVRRTRDGNTTSYTTSGTGWRTISGLEADTASSTYRVTVSSPGYQSPLPQNIIVDSNSTRDYVFCLAPDAGTLAFAWTPVDDTQVGRTGTFPFRAGISNNSSAVFNNVKLHFKFDGNEVGSMTKDIAAYSTVNYSADWNYNNLAYGWHKFSITVSAFGGAEAPVEERDVRVILLAGVFRGKVTDCQTGGGIASSVSDANPKVMVTIDGASAPMDIATDGSYTYSGIQSGTYSNMFVSRSGFDPSAPKTGTIIIGPIAQDFNFCMNRQTGSLVAEVRANGGPIANKSVYFTVMDPLTKNMLGFSVATNSNGFTGGIGIPVENYGNMTASWSGATGVANPSPVRIYSSSTTTETFLLSGSAVDNPTATLSASPASIPYNGASTISWSTSNAASCWASGAWSGWKINTGGSESTGALTAGKTYNLECWNGAGFSTGIKTATVTVASAPTATLSTSPASIAYGAASTIAWSTSNAASCWADWSGWVATSGSVSTGALTTSRTYNLTCYNGAGVSTGTKTATVTVDSPPTCSINVSPGTVFYGGNPSFTLSSTNAYYCHVIMDGVWDWQASGYFTSGIYHPGILTSSGTHSAWCYCYNSVWSNPNGWSTTNFTVLPAPTATISVSPSSIPYGGSYTMSWSTTDILSSPTDTGNCWGSTDSGSGRVPASGSVFNASLTYNKTYSLECWNGATPPVSTGIKTATVTVASAPTATLSASPASIPYNGASTISWSTSNAASCWASGAWSGWKINTGGSESTGALTAGKTYNLECWNGAGFSTGIKTATVTVASAPTATLSTSPASIAYGGASTLSWSTSNASSCWASGAWSGWKTNTGGSESTGALTAGKSYSLECWNSTGISTGIKTATVTVASAPTSTLTASPASVPYRGTSTISWTTTNATSCWGGDSQSSGWVPTSGSISSGILTSDRGYNLTCYNSAGVSTGTKNVVILVASAPTATLSASLTSIAYGGASTLSWSTSNASSCWASGAWSGWKTNTGDSESTGALTAGKTYNLECWNGAGFSTGIKTATVTVAPIPAPTSISGSSDSNGLISLNWTPVAGAVRYLLRIDDRTTNPLLDLINDNVLVTNYSYTGISGHSYNAWVHACDTLSCGGAVALTSFITCPLPILSLTADPTTVDYNGSTRLTWTTSDTSSCSASGAWSGGKTNTGGSEWVGPLPVSKVYSLECWNSATPPVSTKVNLTVSLSCTPSTACAEPTCDDSTCGRKLNYNCSGTCGGSCSAATCPEKKTCPPCNSGTWREIGQ